MPRHERQQTQILRADPNIRATPAARKAEATHGETEAAGEVGLGAGASEVWAWVIPMRETTAKRTATSAATGVLERAIGDRLVSFFFFLDFEKEASAGEGFA